MNFASYFFSDKLALAMSGAQPLTPESAPDVYQGLLRWWRISRGG